MGYFPAAGQVIGGGLSAYSQVEAGKAASRIADYNANIEEMAARDALDRGEAAANVRRKQGQLAAGTQRVSFAAQGVQLGDGSAADIVYDTLTRADQDATTIKTNAILEAYGHRSQAAMGRLTGATSEATSRAGAAATLIGSVANAGASLQAAGYFKPSPDTPAKTPGK